MSLTVDQDAIQDFIANERWEYKVTATTIETMTYTDPNKLPYSHSYVRSRTFDNELDAQRMITRYKRKSDRQNKNWIKSYTPSTTSYFASARTEVGFKVIRRRVTKWIPAQVPIP